MVVSHSVAIALDEIKIIRKEKGEYTDIFLLCPKCNMYYGIKYKTGLFKCTRCDYRKDPT